MSNTLRSAVQTDRAETSQPAPLLSTDLSVEYPGRGSVLRGVRIEVFPGEYLGLVGESGSGKSTLGLAILRLLDHTGARLSGRTMLFGRDLLCCDEGQLRDIRGRIVSLIPQSPALALNPALRIGTQLREAWHAHSPVPWSTQKARVVHLFTSAGLPTDEMFLKRFPREISVGQAQRVLIVMALLHAPPLMISDEPTSALDVITQRDVLDLLARVGKEHQMGMLFISHDLPIVAALCSRIAILYGAEIVESGPTAEILNSPKHPYTKRLVAAVPRW